MLCLNNCTWVHLLLHHLNLYKSLSRLCFQFRFWRENLCLHQSDLEWKRRALVTLEYVLAPRSTLVVLHTPFRGPQETSLTNCCAATKSFRLIFSQETLHGITRQLLDLKNHLLQTFCAVLAFVAFGGEVYILLQTRLYGDKLTIASDDTSLNDMAVLRSYLFWLAAGVTVAAGLNFVVALVATARLSYWRLNFRKKTFWKLTLLPVLSCFGGLTAGILPVLLKRDDASAMAVLIILALYFQTPVWALVLAWRDVRMMRT